MNKDQIADIVIEDMAEDGAGIGKADGYPLFVKDAVGGEEQIFVLRKLAGFVPVFELLLRGILLLQDSLPFFFGEKLRNPFQLLRRSRQQSKSVVARAASSLNPGIDRVPHGEKVFPVLP